MAHRNRRLHFVHCHNRLLDRGFCLPELLCYHDAALIQLFGYCVDWECTGMGMLLLRNGVWKIIGQIWTDLTPCDRDSGDGIWHHDGLHFNKILPIPSIARFLCSFRDGLCIHASSGDSVAVVFEKTWLCCRLRHVWSEHRRYTSCPNVKVS